VEKHIIGFKSVRKISSKQETSVGRRLPLQPKANSLSAAATQLKAIGAALNIAEAMSHSS
jgi:hypothetical protein